MGDSIEDRLAGATELTRMTLEGDSFREIRRRLGPYGQPDSAFRLLSGIKTATDTAGVVQLCASIAGNAEQHLVERALLMLSSQHASPQVPGLPVADSVKRLFADEFRFFASPPPVWVAHFRNDDVRFREMARVATLRRFPVGQFQFQMAAFPRSWVIRAAQPVRLLFHLLGRMGGFGPLFELHVNDRRKNRVVLLETEANLSYYRAARSLEKQPAVRGLMLGSWLFCQSTAQISPHLAWLRRIPLSAGALIADLGPAATDAGFLKGSEERRKLYEQGLYRPQATCVLWPRNKAIEWANQHPEFDA